MKCPIPEEDLNKDELEYDVDTDNENYIKWITRGEGGSFEDSPTGLYAENNNNVATTSQENTFTNENQNDDDILAVSGGFKTDDIANECCFQNQNIELLQQQSTECAANLSKEVNMDEAPEDIKNETYTDDYVSKRIKELKLQEDELEQKKMLLQNEERELELKIKKEKQKLELKRENEKLELLESLKQSEQQDNMMNKKRNGLIPTQYNYTNQPLYFNKKYPKRQYINNKVYLSTEEEEYKNWPGL